MVGSVGSVFRKSQEGRFLAAFAFGKCAWGKEIDEAIFLEWEDGRDIEQTIYSSHSFLFFHNSKK